MATHTQARKAAESLPQTHREIILAILDDPGAPLAENWTRRQIAHTKRRCRDLTGSAPFETIVDYRVEGAEHGTAKRRIDSAAIVAWAREETARRSASRSKDRERAKAAKGAARG